MINSFKISKTERLKILELKLRLTKEYYIKRESRDDTRIIYSGIIYK